MAQQIWEGVRANDKKAVYHHIVNSKVDVNAMYGQVTCGSSLTLAKAMLLNEQTSIDQNSSCITGNSLDRSSSGSLNFAGTSEGQTIEDLDGCTLLHLACETGDIGMLELLLQYGANINATDSRGQTPLHRCILRGKVTFSRLLLTRGADPRAVNGEGKTCLELAVESNFADSEILAELGHQISLICSVANKVFSEMGSFLSYKVGMMIEIPRDALVADEVWGEELSSYVNILIFDVGKFLPIYLSKGILQSDPFEVLDQKGVGQLIKMATEKGLTRIGQRIKPWVRNAGLIKNSAKQPNWPVEKLACYLSDDGTGSPKHEFKHSAHTTSELGMLNWVYNSGEKTILDIFVDASSDMV